MKTLERVDARFSASHQFGYDHPRCGPRLHGHDWQFAVHGVELDRASIEALARELHNRHLPDMVKGGVHTPEGMTAYITERLRLANPGMRFVEVWFLDQRFSIEV